MELYIHIPFCVQKCKYCSFVSFPASSEEKDAYVREILREAEIRADQISSPIKTLYIGGGTPSILSPLNLIHLVEGIRSLFPFEKKTEFTVEANPGTLTSEFAETASFVGVNRISLGMQAFQPDILRFLGRIHLFDDVKQAVSIIRKAQIHNLNLDLIFGIPGQSLADWEETLNAALSLEPEHISAYGLIPEEGTPLYQKLENKEVFLPDPDLERQMYDLAIAKLHHAGLEQYEISNFARPGFECRHNIGYWTQKPYIGLGLSAASMLIVKQEQDGLTCLRQNNPSDPTAYTNMISSSDFSSVSTETVLPKDSRFETMMLALRMNCGISEDRFRNLHGISIEECFGKKLYFMQQKGLMRHENGAWFLTRKGMDIQNSILVEFMEEDK